MSVTISGSGQIIKQVVQAVKLDTSTFSAIGSFTDIPGLSLSITPSNAANKIMLVANINFGISATTTCMFNWVRNGTAIAQPSPTNTFNCSFRSAVPLASWSSPATSTYMDSPSTTSAITYKIQFMPYDTGRTVKINNAAAGGGGSVDDSYCISTITAYEIAYA